MPTPTPQQTPPPQPATNAPAEYKHPGKHIAMISLSILITGALVGGGVYAWHMWQSGQQQEEADQAITDLQDRNQDLETRVADYESEVEAEEEKNAAGATLLDEVPDITFETSDDGYQVTVKNHGATIGTIESEYQYSNVSIFDQTNEQVFVSINPDGLGGYALYGGAYTLYRVDLLENTITQLDYEGQAYDISADGQGYVYASGHKILVKGISGGEAIEFEIDEKYGQYGDVMFSPNGQKLAYAAAHGVQTDEYGAVIIIDLTLGTQSILTEGENTFFTIEGWVNNESVSYLQH